jgi:hypothetical protein
MKKLESHIPFIVSQSKGINIFVALAFFGLFISSFFNNDPTVKGGGFRWAYLALIPAILFFIRGIYTKEIIRISRQGIFYLGELVTKWENFVDARIDQDEILLSIQDNFVLFIRYKEGDRLFQTKIPLRNTYNKAEEEIIAAIRFFSVSKNHRF